MFTLVAEGKHMGGGGSSWSYLHTVFITVTSLKKTVLYVTGLYCFDLYKLALNSNDHSFIRLY